MADIFAIVLVGIIIFGASRRVYNKDSNRLLDKEQTLNLKGIAASYSNDFISFSKLSKQGKRGISNTKL